MSISRIDGAERAVDPFASKDAAYRDADFMAIMLAEISQQDPFDPVETSELVKGMHQLQTLANTRFEKYRNDVDWAQRLMGQTVVVGQVQLSDAEYQAHVERGLQPDLGFDTVSGPVVYFRNVGESVWVRVGEHDYPIDNVQVISPELLNETHFTNMAADLVGRSVGYLDAQGELQQGVVDHISWDDYGKVSLHIGDLEIPFERIRAIGTQG